MTTPNPFLLAADNSPSLLPLLRSNPHLASSQDAHGYSLLHAAASYNHTSLLRTLINEFHVSPNIKDEDEETPLFVAETVETAELLIRDLGADAEVKNRDGMTAEEKIRGEGDFTAVADYLKEVRREKGDSGQEVTENGDQEVEGEGEISEQRPPPLPPNVTVNVGTMEEEGLGEADPVFKQRIEELAAREDFQGEEAQRELRELVRDAVRGVGEDSARDVRRRIG
ncbi:MAG: hypothetical protein Q9190_006710 [Brigantiaea leucoxantha]